MDEPSNAPATDLGEPPANPVTASAIAVPAGISRHSLNRHDSSTRLNWLLVGAVVLAIGLVTYNRWAKARTVRRLSAAADAYASRELDRLRRAAEGSLEGLHSHILENAPCSS